MKQIKFHPIQCTSQQLFDGNLTLHEGQLYFLTDTKQIYVVQNDKAIEMCGGTNIVYGTREIVYENDGKEVPPEQEFSIADDLNNGILMVNDLILNKDGCFYKVVSIDGDEVQTLRVTLQGSGFGGGSSTGPSGGASYGISLLTQNNVFSSKTDHMYIGFRADCQQVDDNFISYICFTFEKSYENGGIPFYEMDGVHYDFNQDHEDIDLINYIDLFDGNQKTVYLNTYDRYGNSRSKSFTIRLVDLLLTPVYGAILKNSSDNVDICPYSCNIGGATSGISNKKLSISFFSEANSMKPVYSYDVDMATNKLDNFDIQLDLSKIAHGVYDLEIALNAKIVGTEKTLFSNVLKHKIIKFVDSTSPLLAVQTPSKLEQYTNNEIYYRLVTNDTNNYSLKIKLDSVEKAEILINANETQNYPLYIDERQGTCNLSFSVPELGIEKTTLIDIVSYSGNLPVIDPADSSLKLYLTPNGYSNNLKDRDKWFDYNGRYAAQLSSNLNYSNSSGWVVDSDGVTCLQLNSGSRMDLTNYEPFEQDPTQPIEGATRGTGFTVELDFEVSAITDYTKDIIRCISTNPETKANAVGFSLTGNVLKFFSKQKNGYGTQGALTSLTITEGRRVRASFVLDPNMDDNAPDYNKYFPMCHTYINGILSNAVIYEKNDEFKQFSSSSKALLSVDSTYAAIKIYGIRIYQTALTARQILNNYTASLPTLVEREQKYKTNNVYNDQSLIDYGIVSSEEYNLQIPYMLLTGGYKTDADNDKWQLLPSDKVGQPGLPTGKKDYRMVDVKVVYPDIPYFNRYEEFGGYNDYNFVNQFANGKWITDNFGKKASNGGCIMYAQGTSSMEYPVKNLRLRFNKVKKMVDGEEIKSKENYFTVRPDIEPVEIICMKADYMESSGSHNTGAANLIDDLYKIANMKTPGQEHFGPREGKEDANTIVTCIKGHPCLIFYSPSGEKGTYQYIGKYNLNLDKATPTPFGFDHDDNFGWLPVGHDYWEIDYDDEGDKFIGQKEPDTGGDYKEVDGEKLKQVENGEKINSIHCFEFLDNAVAVCNFLNKKPSDDDIDTNPVQQWEYIINRGVTSSTYKPNTFYIHNGTDFILSDSEVFSAQEKYYDKVYTFEDTWYRLFKKNVEGEIKNLPGWALGFESRYPEDRIGYHDADMLYPMASWLNEIYRLKTYGSNVIEGPTQADIDRANARFIDEYQRYLDKQFLLFYYIVTETLLMADNRVKNMMIATWGPEERTFIKQDKTTETVNDYIWYPIFYDMDTMLGLDNTGVDRFNYYDEDTDASIYNGDEVLWNFVRDNLGEDLDQMYSTLENLLNTRAEADGSWSPQSLIPYFNTNQANMANEAFYNGDATYKYLDPARQGYYDGLNGKDIAPGDAPYLYAAQGDRSLARENFIINRIKFLQGKHSSSLFLNSDQIEFRWNYPNQSSGERYAEVIFSDEKVYEAGKYYYQNDKDEFVIDTSITKTNGRQYYELIQDDALTVSAGAVPPTTDFNFIATQPCFSGVLLGKNGSVYKERFGANEAKTISVPEGSSANNTEAYILGLSSLKTLGDLSNKYVQKFVMSGKNKLSELILGNPHKDYYNPYWSSDTSSARIGLDGCTSLETFNLQNCSSFRSALNFSSCPIIKTILLTGSSVGSITLPINGNLQELRLPSTITELDINSHRQLRNFSLGTYDYKGGQRIGDGEYVNDFSNLTKVYIVDTPIDSYNVLSNAISLTSYYVENFNWEINDINDCQYIYTTDTTPVAGKTYYVWDNTTKGFVEFVGNETSEDWSRAREKCNLVQSGEIVQIPILEQLLKKDAEFQGRKLSSIPGYPGANGLVGTIKISVDAKVNEFNIYNKYKKYFPNVIFEFNVGEDNLSQAYTIEFYNTEYTNELKPYYTVMTNGNMTLAELTSASGPNGIALSTPNKAATDTETFEFTGQWKIIGTDNFISSSAFGSTTPKENLKLEAQFKGIDRVYEIKFYDYNGQNPQTVGYYFNQYMINNSETPKYQTRPETGLNEFERYTFVGWINQKDYIDNTKNPKIIDLETTQVNLTTATDLYPYYKIEDARTVATDLKYFNFEEKNIVYYKKPYDGGNNIKIDLGMQYVITLKEEYQNSLSGKITIPSVDSNNRVVTAVGDFAVEEFGIKEIYFLPNSKCKILGNNGCFKMIKNLERVYFPQEISTLEYIGDSCFYYLQSLSMIDNLPNTIKHIGDYAFSWVPANFSLPSSLEYAGESTFSGSGVLVNQWPEKYKDILPYTFSYGKSLTISHFGNAGTLSGNANNITNIGRGAFYMTSNSEEPKSITLDKSIENIGEEAFYNYGWGGPTEQSPFTVYDKTNLITSENFGSIFGTRANKSIIQGG